jgi:hypothetical protein
LTRSSESNSVHKPFLPLKTDLKCYSNSRNRRLQREQRSPSTKCSCKTSVTSYPVIKALATMQQRRSSIISQCGTSSKSHGSLQSSQTLVNGRLTARSSRKPLARSFEKSFACQIQRFVIVGGEQALAVRCGLTTFGFCVRRMMPGVVSVLNPTAISHLCGTQVRSGVHQNYHQGTSDTARK